MLRAVFISALCLSVAFAGVHRADEAIEASADEASGDDASVAIDSTTAAIVDESTTIETASNSTACKPASVCYGDGECNQGGRCIGAFTSKCNCNACIEFWRCETDEACGGLKGACDEKHKVCKCMEAYTALGYASFFDAFRTLCNVKDCSMDAREDTCHGLPCHSGFCVCEEKKKEQ